MASALPLVERRPAAAARPRRRVAPATPAQPVAGLRVLDLTRVIAGPVGTRMLAALGADVLRIDPPQMPELELAVLDTCPGKRLAALDLRRPDDRATFDALLAEADVLVHGYRPGALAAFGLDDEEVAARHPHLVVASLSAWGAAGPWAGRRGFDSLVQAACGIAVAEGEGGVPGALPVQALDHATGYLLAAAVLREVAARRRGEEGSTLRLALAATAAELMRRPRQGRSGGRAGGLRGLRRALGELSVIAPPGSVDGRPLGWGGPPRRDAPALGSSTVKHAPPPLALAAVTRPPWARTMPSTMASPRPAPALPRSRPPSERQKRSKISRPATGRPGPWSRTTTCAVSPSRRTVTLIGVPGRCGRWRCAAGWRGPGAAGARRR